MRTFASPHAVDPITPPSRPTAPARWALAAFVTLTAWAAGPAWGQAAGQAPLAQASVEALVSALAGGGPATRSFRRTQLPQADSNLCSDAGGKPAAGGKPGAGTANGGARGRNLEVVPYAGDTTPGVNLSVQFATASDKLAGGDRGLLDNLAAALKSADLAAERFAIAGHTDSSGDARINLELSCARALAVQRYLVSKGVAEARISAYGFGSERPMAGTEASNGQNRRVEVRKAPQ